jgi:hypothetical protein
MLTTSLRRLASVVVTAVMSLGVASIAQADDETTIDAPCAVQQAQVAKAEAALERVTAVHAAHPNKGTTKATKAQQQRLTKAEARLASCVAAQPE